MNLFKQLKGRALALFGKRDATGYARQAAQAAIVKRAADAPIVAPVKPRKPRPAPLFTSVRSLPQTDRRTSVVRMVRVPSTFNAGRNAAKRAATTPAARRALLTARRERQLACTL